MSAGAYFLAQRAPGAFSTRLFIALGLVTYSALFVSQSHGLIEMHFHFFGALAFLLVYRDWRVIVAAAAFVAVHHLAFMVLQDAGAPVWVMAHAHLSFGHGRAARRLRRLRDDRARDPRALARDRDAGRPPRCASRTRAERAQLALLADALERRDLSRWRRRR